MVAPRRARTDGVRRGVRGRGRSRLSPRRRGAVPLSGVTLAGRIWGGAPFDAIADGASAAHDALVAALDPRPGERFLDVATGTGAVAMRAAARGARVCGVDIAAQLLETARARAPDADFRVADATDLPFEDGAFDVVASAQGVVFADDPRRVASELARVSAPGARLGLTCPEPSGFAFGLARILASFGATPTEVWFAPFRWGREDALAALLGADYELRVDRIDIPFRAQDPRAGWQVYEREFGPLKATAAALPPAGRAELRARVIELLARHETPDGVVAPRPMLLVVGRRRG